MRAAATTILTLTFLVGCGEKAKKNGPADHPAATRVAPPTTATTATKPTTKPRPAPAAAADFEKALAAAHPGDVVLTSMKSLDPAPPIDLNIVDAHGPQYLFSDKPEYFRIGNGIAMQEKVKPGTVRLYLYHVPGPANDATIKKNIAIVLENLADAPLNLRFTKYAPQKPGGDYHKIGKGGLIDFWTEKSVPAPLTVPPKGRIVLDSESAKVVLKKDILIHGLYQFEIDQPAQISTLQCDPTDDPTKVIDTLTKLPRLLPGFHPSGAGRGLFMTSDYDVSPKDASPFDTSKGPRTIVVADGKTDPWIKGIDSLAPTEDAFNKGNYGVMYRVKLKYTSPDGKGVALLICNGRADGNVCSVAAAAMKVNAGNSAGGAIPLPREQVRFEGLPEAVVVQTYPPVAAGQTGEIEFVYSPPGASCLPTPLVLVPYEAK